MLRDHRKLRRVPHLVLIATGSSTSTRSSCATSSSGMFRVDNPEPKPGLRRIVRDELQAQRPAAARPGPRRLDGGEELRMSDELG